MSQMKRYFIAVPAIFSALTSYAFAQVEIKTGLPGVTSTADPGKFIGGIYNFAFLIAGVLALGAIVYGGVKYMTSAGNPSGQSEGREWIKGAIFGLLLLFGAYFILNIINPDITKLSLPTLAPIPAGQIPPGQISPGGLSCQGGACASLASAGISCKDPNSCSAAPAMVASLQCMGSAGGGFIVNEAMPPTVPHISQCHNNGCCVDVVVSSFNNCAQVQQIIQAARSCGATNVANEYSNCGGTRYDTTTGNNIHIQSC